jgi:cellobiose-specific phosphotransferase system component IIC
MIPSAMAGLLKLAVLGLCSLTLLAICDLAVSVAVLQPPRVNDSNAVIAAAVLATLTILTLAAASRPAPPLQLRVAAAATGALLLSLGAWLIAHTLASEHFEGYELLLGAMLAAQGTFTAVYFAAAISRT